jgi:phosphoserine phosphatase RsbU/P
MFISMCYVVIHRTTGEITLARAGHDAPLCFNASTREVTRINPPGMALGIDSGDVFDRIIKDVNVPLNSGDCLVLYTDGITEAQDQNAVEYGIEKVISAIQVSARESSSDVIRRLTDDFRIFIGDQPQHDDVTLIAIRRL